MARDFSEQADIRKLRQQISRYSIGGTVRHLSDHCMIRLAAHIYWDLFDIDPYDQIPDFTADLGDFYEMTPDIEGAAASSPAQTLAVLQDFTELHPDGLKSLHLLAEIYKRRLRFAHILSQSRVPSPVDLGHRSLIEAGTCPKEIADHLRVRKMLYDIDNRSAQESAYLYMKIMASVLGGETVSSRNSPILKNGSSHARRAVDCIAGRRAYDFKARMTEAPSRRARFADETLFARDCFASGYIPVLLVLNQLPGQRSVETIETFERYGGEVYIGSHAWDHIREVAGPILSRFLDSYIHPRADAVALEDGPLEEGALWPGHDLEMEI